MRKFPFPQAPKKCAHSALVFGCQPCADYVKEIEVRLAYAEMEKLPRCPYHKNKNMKLTSADFSTRFMEFECVNKYCEETEGVSI